jgi:hypothetical protein
MKHFYAPFLMLIFLAIACEAEVKIVTADPTTTSFTDIKQSTKVTAKALELNGTEIPEIPLSFRSDNTAIADVNDKGIITPVSSGNAIITVSAPNGKEAQTFVKVCLPKEIKCNPEHTLALRVGTAAPIKCKLYDCKDEEIPGGKLSFEGVDEEAVMKDGPNTFIGKKVGQTSVKVKGGGLEKEVIITIAEQIFAPGMEPGSGGHGGGGGGGGVDKNKDPYGDGGKGQFNHIIGKMKF